MEQLCVGMAPNEASDAQAAYAIQSALVELALEELHAALRAHEGVWPIDKARVVMLERVRSGLAELVAYLSAK